MIAVDTNILVYAHRAEVPWHAAAKREVTLLAESGATWGIPMHCLIEFYAKVTDRRLFKPASTPAQAIAQIDAWLESPQLSVLADNMQTWTNTRMLLAAANVLAGEAFDARIAAVCLQYGVGELWTTDRDFLAYPALRVRNPLVDIHPSTAREPRARYATRRRPR